MNLINNNYVKIVFDIWISPVILIVIVIALLFFISLIIFRWMLKKAAKENITLYREYSKNLSIGVIAGLFLLVLNQLKEELSLTFEGFIHVFISLILMFIIIIIGLYFHYNIIEK